MKRSTINKAVQSATSFLKKNHWELPPNPRWDVTDFGLGDFRKYGLVLINLAEEKEYCEKLMYAQQGMITPSHTHKLKKEDIIVRNGKLAIKVWKGQPGGDDKNQDFELKINGEFRKVQSSEIIELISGERVTLVPGIYHEFWPVSEECIIGEVSTDNDDINDNVFINPDIGRFSKIEEDEPAIVKLVSD
jgi:D-lyxose ketol-isomerase